MLRRILNRKKKENLIAISSERLDLLPNEILCYIAMLLPVKDRYQLLATCKTLFQMEDVSFPYWVDVLLELGVKPELCRKLHEENRITNYKKLCHTLIRIPQEERTKINDVWVIYSLSGDIDLIKNVCEEKALTLNSEDSNKRKLKSYLLLNGRIFYQNAVSNLIPFSERFFFDESIFNFSNTNFSGFDLSGIDLSNLDFHGANLESAKLNHCNAENTNFKKANLLKIEFFRMVIIDNTKFLRAKVSRDFVLNLYHLGRSLAGLNMYRIDLSNIDLSGANLSGVLASYADFTNTVLTGADLSRGDFDHAIFIKANLDKATIEGRSPCSRGCCKSEPVEFFASNISGASFVGASIQYSNFSYAQAVDSCFRFAFIKSVTYTYADLTNSDFTGANSNRNYFKKSKLGGTVFENTNFNGYERHFEDTTLQNFGLDYIRHIAKTAEKTLANILVDYSKGQSNAHLFFAGHWNKHHIKSVREVLKKITQASTATQIFAELDTALGNKNIPLETTGSLYKGLSLVAHVFKLGKLEALLPHVKIKDPDAEKLAVAVERLTSLK